MEEELEILQSIYPDDIKNINLDKYDKIIFNKKKHFPKLLYSSAIYKSDKPSFEILISSTNTDNDDDNRKSLILTLIINFPKEVTEFYYFSNNFNTNN